MHKPRIAIISFPGSNGETENLRCFWRNGFDAFVFRWNDDREQLSDVDGYFIGAGFSYEDRGRAGMVAARDPLFDHLHAEAEKGKVIIGHCNGAQVLVESGLVPVGNGLRMSLARNVIINQESDVRAPGFLNEWIYITPTCKPDRCAASDWQGTMKTPIAHGEGRFITKDPDLIAALEENDQIAFRYCDASGKVSADSPITPNGSTDAIAGICNPAGNVVAIMPHAERAGTGDVYFESVKKWIESGKRLAISDKRENIPAACRLPLAANTNLQKKHQNPIEIFIDTIIVNNEERTVEQAARRIRPTLKLKQFKYMAPTEKSAEEILNTIALFNPNKEVAYVKNNAKWFKWNPDKKTMNASESPLSEVSLIRRDEPDIGAQGLGEGSETGVCYSLSNVTETELENPALQEIFGNPHASSLAIC